MTAQHTHIKGVEAYFLQHQLGAVRGPSIVDYSTREVVLIKITDDEGRQGWGECYGVSGIGQLLEEMARLLPGLDPTAAARRWRSPWKIRVNPWAAGGLSIALDDLRARQLGIPVHQLYGGAVRQRVRAYASSGGYFAGIDPGVTWPKEVEEQIAAGYTAIKLRTGRYPPAHELPLLRRLREETAREIDLMLDGNAGYTFSQAIQVGEALGEMGYTWFEEPMPQAGYVGYDRLAARLEIPLAGGEVMESRWEANELLAKASFDIVQPDVAICGGIGEVLFIAELAELNAIRCIPHAWGGAVLLAATLHAVSLLNDPTRSPATLAPLVEVDSAENPFRDHVLREPFKLVDGHMELPSGSGLGVEVDEEWVQRHGVALFKVGAAEARA
jgi:D-galactarolactone cycloisomerase